MGVENHLIKPHSDFDPNSANPLGLDWMKLQPAVGHAEQNTTAGFTAGGGTNEIEFTGAGIDNLESYLRHMLGGSYVYRTVGKTIQGVALQASEHSGIDRVLPLGHPQHPFLYCSGVNSIKGTGYLEEISYPAWFKSMLPMPNNGTTVPCYPTFSRYGAYDIKATFTARTYQQLRNNDIYQYRQDVVFIPANQYNTDSQAENRITIPGIWPEWWRYVFKRVEPKFETLSAVQGQFAFFDPNNTLVRPITQPGQIKIPYPSQEVKLTWYKVPYSFVNSGATGSGGRTYRVSGYPARATLTNENMLTYCNYKVNQYDFMGYKAGTLLLTGVSTTEPEANPFPAYTEWPPGSGNYIPDNTFTTDITFTFLYREPRPAINYEALGYYPGGVGGNNVFYGHNLVPNYADGLYYAAIKTEKLTSSGVVLPKNYYTANLIYESFPFQLLFADPSYVMPYLP